MAIIRTHKIRLVPTPEQEVYFRKACGVARFAYNWALTEWTRQYQEHLRDPSKPRPSEGSLRKQLNAIKAEEFPWMLEVTKCAPQRAIQDLGQAFKRFFAKKSKYPKFKKKNQRDRFYLDTNRIKLDNIHIKIPNLSWIRMRESLRFRGKVLSATISRVADQWHVSIAVETHLPRQVENQDLVGVDLGVKSFAVTSHGEIMEGPKPYRRLLKRVQRLSRQLSRKQKGSKNREKAKMKLARLHLRISNIRRDFLHKLTTELCRNYRVICIEDLNVGGMWKLRSLAQALGDQRFGEYRKQLEYKSLLYGNILVIANRWFSSSKTCSSCGHKLEKLDLSVREWTCPSCGTQHDRDLNAAINLAKYAASSVVSACGGESSGCDSLSCNETIPEEAGKSI